MENNKDSNQPNGFDELKNSEQNQNNSKKQKIVEANEIEKVKNSDEELKKDEILLSESENKNEDSYEDFNSKNLQSYIEDDSKYIQEIKPLFEDEKDLEKSKKSLGKRISDYWKRNDNTASKIIITILIALLVALIIVGIYFYSRLSLLGTNHDEISTTVEEDVIYEDVNFSMMNDITDAHSLNEILKKWATNNGEKMSSKNVINVLLIGVDSQSRLSDSMMLLSLNKSTKKINMISFYRDSYTYIQPESKKPRYAKLNSAFVSGGPSCVVNTIENDYKIKIDDYAYVDYDTFPKVIDALGGVKVDLQSYEADYMNREYGYNFKAGNVTLTGDQTLWYCRIRYSDKDGDISRTRRQRAVITSIIDSAKNANMSKLDSLITTLFPNIKTSMSKTQVVSYATQALSKDWLNFEIVQASMPTTDTSKGGYIGSQWVWICDYPGAAYQLQTLLYGKSNIKLEADRISAINLKPTTTATKSYSNSSTKIKSTTSQAPTQTSSTQASSSEQSNQNGGQNSGNSNNGAGAVISESEKRVYTLPDFNKLFP